MSPVALAALPAAHPRFPAWFGALFPGARAPQVLATAERGGDPAGGPRAWTARESTRSRGRAVVAIVQARMGSTRLPGKVLRDLGGRTMLAQVLRRLQACTRVDRVVVATSTAWRDDPVAAEARGCGVECSRGSETDVLGRYADAALQFTADTVVRITADCPLIDPGVVDRVVADLLDGDPLCDYASNTVVRTFPRGLDVEAMYADTLGRLARVATSDHAREHVTAFIHERPELFRIHSVVDRRDNSDLRFTVDTAEDWRLVDTLYRELDLTCRIRPFDEVVEFVRRRPELAAINAHVVQKPHLMAG